MCDNSCLWGDEHKEQEPVMRKSLSAKAMSEVLELFSVFIVIILIADVQIGI